ncbi:hypothetical protein SAY87_008278 [Trapa incisa]|uniref:TFIIS N-terminal domain-containing protein n=1 Tax=Trapa incisa TaxID=236973 RepID=A0AAN7QFV3_9MYRT|nr:hypothetical protein SAY87_008278 [Trapa incisa]
MHASVQQNDQSPKQMSSYMSTAQLKPGSDSLQNAASMPTQGKGKKREHADQTSNTLKHVNSMKVEEGDSDRSESFLKSEITKVVEEGPIIDMEGIDRLVRVMFIDITERKMDLSARRMLTSVIISTEKSDCLSRFIQMRGLIILDNWLQDAHKGKVGDTFCLKDNGMVAEEFLLVLLRALDKLPVNLNALQMCNIGKSVNHLRTHKNVEIQKKARSLVDTWKKRVEAEMNMNHAKMSPNQAVSWSTRLQTHEVPCVDKTQVGSSEGAPKSPSFQLSASKTALEKPLHGKTTSESASQFQGPIKIASPQASTNIILKDGQPCNSGILSTVPLTTSRDEKSSNSSPSHNSSQSCSSDHVKNGVSAIKEDARSSATALNKMPCLASRHKKSANAFSVSVASARETGPCRTTSYKNRAPDKTSHSGLSSGKATDVTSEVNSHMLSDKISNRNCSLSPTAAGVSVDDSSAMNRRPSSPFLGRPDQLDAVMEENADASQVNTLSNANSKSCQGNSGDPLNAHDEGNVPVHSSPGMEHSDTDENTRNTHAVSRGATSSPRNTLKLSKVFDASMCSMHALIESCVKDTEANSPVSTVDDGGMHLLASVAAGEMLKSEVASSVGSPHGPLSVEPSYKVNDPDKKTLPLDGHLQDDNLTKDVSSHSTQTDHFKGSSIMPTKGGRETSFLCTGERCSEEEEQHAKFCGEVDQVAVPSHVNSKIFKKLAIDSSNTEMDTCSEGRLSKNNASLEGPQLEGMPYTEIQNDDLLSQLNSVRERHDDVISISGREIREIGDESDDCGLVEAKPTGKILSAEMNEKELKTSNGIRAEEDSEVDAGNKNEQTEKSSHLIVLEVQTTAGSGSDIVEHLQSEIVSEKKVIGALSNTQTGLPLQDVDVNEKSGGSEVVTSKEANETLKCDSFIHSSIALPLDRGTKLGFDLNEGFSNDDDKLGKSMSIKATSIPVVSVSSLSSLPITTSSSPASLPTPIAVTATAAKVLFMPPDDLLQEKVEIGWKGSAATSAFCPTEPRKLLDTPTNAVGTTHSLDISLGKQSFPLLDFDLNVADERIIEDAYSQSPAFAADSVCSFRSKVEKAHNEMIDSAPTHGYVGLGLDLNHVHKSSTDDLLVRNGQKVEIGVGRDFDLNDQPVVDTFEPSTSGHQQLSSRLLANQLPLSGLWMNGTEMGKFSTLFHASNSYVPAPYRGNQSFPIFAAGAPPRMLSPTASGIQFSPEMYQGPVLSFSQGLPFTPAPFQYPVFPYGTNFSFPSATLSGSPTTYIDPAAGGRLGFPPQFLGPSGAVASHFSRPYMASLSDGSGNIESSKKCSRQGLDLNMGPGGSESEPRDEALALGPKRLSIGGPQSLAEEQARIYQVNSGLLKRKEPEGGWDGYKQSSWHR